MPDWLTVSVRVSAEREVEGTVPVKTRVSAVPQIEMDGAVRPCGEQQAAGAACSKAVPSAPISSASTWRGRGFRKSK